jgi:hypothetical protein
VLTASAERFDDPTEFAFRPMMPRAGLLRRQVNDVGDPAE